MKEYSPPWPLVLISGARCVADIYDITEPMDEETRREAEIKLDELSGPYAGSS